MARFSPLLELRLRTAARLEGLSYGAWRERVLRRAADEALARPEAAGAFERALVLYRGGATPRAAAAGEAVQGPRRPGPAVDPMEVVRLGAQGLSGAEIAVYLEVTEQTVERARRRAGWRIRDTPAAPVTDDELRALHGQGLTASQIAEQAGLKLSSTRTRLSRLGLRDNARRKE